MRRRNRESYFYKNLGQGFPARLNNADIGFLCTLPVYVNDNNRVEQTLCVHKSLRRSGLKGRLFPN